MKKLEQEIDTDFDSKYQYYHFYADHLLYSLGQIGNRFIATDKDRGLNLERKNANCINFEFTQEKYPILSDKSGRNTIEHIDEHNQSIIKNEKGVGGFNLIDFDTDNSLIDVFTTRRKTHPYTLDLINQKIMIMRKGNEIDIGLYDLKQELLNLYDKVIYFRETLKNVF